MALRLANTRSFLRASANAGIATRVGTGSAGLGSGIGQRWYAAGVHSPFGPLGTTPSEGWWIQTLGGRPVGLSVNGGNGGDGGNWVTGATAKDARSWNGHAPYTARAKGKGDISHVNRTYANTFKPQRRNFHSTSSTHATAAAAGIPVQVEQCSAHHRIGTASYIHTHRSVFPTMSRLPASLNASGAATLRKHTRSLSSAAANRLQDSGYYGTTTGAGTQPQGLLTAGKHYHSHTHTTGTNAATTAAGATGGSGFAGIGGYASAAAGSTNSGNAQFTSVNYSNAGAGVAAASTLSGHAESHGRRRSSVSGLSYRPRAASLPPRTGSLQARQSYPLSTNLNVGAVAEFVGEALGTTPAHHDTVEDFFRRPPPRSGIDGLGHYMKVPLTDLVRSYAILKLCTFVGAYPRLLEKGMDLFTSVAPGFVQSLVYALTVKPTFFHHFCGGANLAETFQRSRDSLRQDGLGIILEYSVEADLSADSVKAADKAADAVKEQISQAIAAAQAESRTHPGARRISSPARSAAHAPASGLDDSMLAIKISAMCPPSVLYRVSEAYTTLMHSYHTLAARLRRQPTVSEAMTELSWLPWFENELKNVAQASQRSPLAKMTSPETTPVYLLSLLKNPTRQIDHIDVENMFACYLLQFSGQAVESAPGPFNIFSGEDQIAYQKMMGRVAKLCQEAGEEVPMLVDAEQTYFQPAITLVTTLLSSHFNRRYPTLWNTQQMYLKAGVPEVERYVEKAQREGWVPALKLVRGAYMVSERARAERLGISDPIHETLQDTHDGYNRALQFLLVNQPADPYVMVASHNEESLKYAAGLLRQGVSASNRVGFAQLKGMCDSVTVDLARQGLKTYKWVPYGPVKDAIPYLVRRIQENSTLLSSPAAQEDLRQMQQSLFTRLSGNVTGRKTITA